MSVTAVELMRAGLQFYHREQDGQPRVKGPAELRAVLLAEIARRADALAAQPVRAGEHPRLTTEPSPRWGGCDCCNDPMPAHVGGWCPLCAGAHRELARRSKTP